MGDPAVATVVTFNASPGDLPMPSPERERQILDRLADDLQVPNDRILDHAIRKERLPPMGRVGLDPYNRVPDVL
jgi:hypothetical protein